MVNFKAVLTCLVDLDQIEYIYEPNPVDKKKEDVVSEKNVLPHESRFWGVSFKSGNKRFSQLIQHMKLLSTL